MKKILYIVFCFFILNINTANSEIVSGKINHDDINYSNKIVDTKTGKAISGAKISIPEINYTTFSDKNGAFQLNADLNDKTVLFVEHEGYKVFSLTIDNNVLKNPLKLGIEESNPFDMQITDSLVHLGDNMFSQNSANSNDFKLYAQGSVLTKTFKMPSYNSHQEVIVNIGTIIGLDTKKAKEIGQNKIAKVYASPAEVFVNSKKIGLLELNGDNIELIIPKHLLKETNELKIKTGKNLFQKDYTDYDDIELANVRIEVHEKGYFAKRN